MDNATFIQALELESSSHSSVISDIFFQLQELPHSFLALNWHSSHEYLYISPRAEALTGHKYDNFLKHGIMFLFSITPAERIEYISTTLYNQLVRLEDNPALITEPVVISVDGAIIDTDDRERPFHCVSTILDYIPGQRKTYLVLSSYISSGDVMDQLEQVTEQARYLQGRLQKAYVKSNPRRFGVFKSYRQLTPRELEIADLIRNGHNSRYIAEKLSIALHTVTSHRKSLLKKMNAGSTTEMVHLLNQI